MSGELDERPDLTALLRNLRDRVYELEHRVSGDANPLALNDLEDVRVDSLGDATITLADGDALVYRASDELWIPGTAGGGGSGNFWEFIPTGVPELLLDSTTTAGIENFYLAFGTGDRTSLEMNDEGGSAGASDQFINVTTTGDFTTVVGEYYTLNAGNDISLGAGRAVQAGPCIELNNGHAEPSTPASGCAVLYLHWNGATNELKIKYDDGSTDVIATQ